MDVGAAFPADGQAPVLVEQGEGLLHDPTASSDFVAGSSARDVSGDPALPQLGVHAGVVVALVAEERFDPAAWWPRSPAQGADPVEYGREHQVVVDIGCGELHDDREPVAAGQQVMFGTGLGAVYRARAGRGAPFFARTCEPSIMTRSKSINPAALLWSRTAR